MFFSLLATGACTSGFLIYISFRIKASFDISVLFNMPSCRLVIELPLMKAVSLATERDDA